MKMRKHIGIILLLLLLSVLGGGGFYLLSRWASGDAGSATATATASGPSEMPTPELLLGGESGVLPGGALATLVRFERSVKSKRADELIWEQAQEKMDLYGNDAVRTFDRSWAHILFGHGDIIEVDENTLIIITKRESRNNELSLALLSPALLRKIADRPEEEQERLLQEAIDAREVRIVKIAGAGPDGEGVRVGVKTLSDQSNSLISRAGTVKVIGPDGTEIILDENMATTLGPDGVLAAPRALLRAPVLASPRDGRLYTFQRKIPRVKLSWKRVNGAAAYRIVMARDAEFNSIFVEEILRKTSLLAYNMEPGSYYWRVKAQDADGIEGDFSSIRTIKTARDDVPPQLAIDFPPDMFIAPGPKLEIRGKTNRGARVRINGHTVPVARDGGFTYTLDLEEGATLITVEAIDSAGNVEYGKRLITYRGKRSTVAMLPEKS